MALPKLETPTYELTLPSSGKKISFRPFLVKEYKILLTLSQASDDEVSRVLKDLVNVCTFEKLNINELPHFDIEYIFLNLRAKSISENVDVIVTCTNCNNKYEASYDIEDLKVEKHPDHTSKIMLTDKIGIEMRYPKFDNVIKLLETDDTAIFTLIRESIVGLFDEDNYYEAKEQTTEEIEEFIFSLTREQYEKLNFFFKTSPKIVQEFESTCSNCNHVNKSRIEGLQNFFV